MKYQLLEGSSLHVLTGAVMGELAMPNVLFRQIAWLRLFESCYLLPLISKVAGNASTGGTAAAPPSASSAPENNGVFRSQETNWHLTLGKKNPSQHNTLLQKPCKPHFSVPQNCIGNLGEKILWMISASLLVLLSWKCHVNRQAWSSPGLWQRTFFWTKDKTTKGKKAGLGGRVWSTNTMYLGIYSLRNSCLRRNQARIIPQNITSYFPGPFHLFIGGGQSTRKRQQKCS